MNDNEISAKDWIRAVARHMHLSPSALAFNAGLSPSTVTRYLNDKTNILSVQQRTLDKLSEYSGVPLLHMPEQQMKIVGTSDIAPYDYQDIDLSSCLHTMAKAMKTQGEIELWLVQTRALDMEGLFPGDLIATSARQRPRSGDIVIATAYSSGDKVLRIYEPPYLMCHSARLGRQRPLLVDEHSIYIKSVCITIARHRK